MASPAASQDTGVVVEDTGQDTRHSTYSTMQEVSWVQRGGGWPSAILVALPVRPGWRGRSGVPRILIVSIIQPRLEEARPPNTETL